MLNVKSGLSASALSAIILAIISFLSGLGWMLDRKKHRQEVEALRADVKQKELDLKKRRTHMKSVRAAKKRKAAALSEGRCPRCGGRLVLRSGKYGEFYGCSNYPSCKYTIEAD